jgi:hypothetical protein
MESPKLDILDGLLGEPTIFGPTDQPKADGAGGAVHSEVVGWFSIGKR